MEQKNKTKQNKTKKQSRTRSKPMRVIGGSGAWYALTGSHNTMDQDYKKIFKNPTIQYIEYLSHNTMDQDYKTKPVYLSHNTMDQNYRVRVWI